MSDENVEKSLPKALRVLLYIGVLLVICFVGIAVSIGRIPQLSMFAEMFRASPLSIWTDEYIFDVGVDRVFADLNGSVAAAGSAGIQVLDAYGNESMRDSFRMTFPAINAERGVAVAFDIGGTALRVFNRNETLVSLNTVGLIVSATINQNGWFVVTTQEGLGTRGVVTVYDNVGREVFQFFSWEGYPRTASLSPDNRNVAVLRLTENGSQVVIFNLASVYYESIFNITDEIILDIRYFSGGNVIAISRDALWQLNINGTGSVLYDFAGRRLGRYTLGERHTVLHLLNFGVGYSGTLITLNRNGQILGELYTDRDIISMTSTDNYLAVLWSDGPAFFNLNLELVPYAETALPISGANQFVALGGRIALAAGEHSAVVVRGY